jgi:hypothetical protein
MIAPALIDSVEDAWVTCAPKGMGVEGTRRFIVANTGQDSWDFWLDVYTSEGRLRRGVMQVERRVVASSSLI